MSKIELFKAFMELTLKEIADDTSNYDDFKFQAIDFLNDAKEIMKNDLQILKLIDDVSHQIETGEAKKDCSSCPSKDDCDKHGGVEEKSMFNAKTQKYFDDIRNEINSDQTLTDNRKKILLEELNKQEKALHSGKLYKEFEQYKKRLLNGDEDHRELLGQKVAILAKKLMSKGYEVDEAMAEIQRQLTDVFGDSVQVDIKQISKEEFENMGENKADNTVH